MIYRYWWRIYFVCTKTNFFLLWYLNIIVIIDNRPSKWIFFLLFFPEKRNLFLIIFAIFSFSVIKWWILITYFLVWFNLIRMKLFILTLLLFLFFIMNIFKLSLWILLLIKGYTIIILLFRLDLHQILMIRKPWFFLHLIFLVMLFLLMFLLYSQGIFGGTLHWIDELHLWYVKLLLANGWLVSVIIIDWL